MPTLNTPFGNLFFADHHPHDANTTPVVLIHGAGSSRLAWPASFRRLSQHRVLAVDLPAHGKSEGQSQTTVAAYADALIQFLEAANIQPAILVGHSMGGAIAQYIAIHHKQYVKGLILITTAAKLIVNAKIIETVKLDKVTVANWINEWAWSPDANDADKQLAYNAMLEVPAEVLYNDYVACDGFDIRDQVSNIQAPTFIIGGTHDKMTPLKFSESLAATIPHSELAIIERGGHWLMLEQPENVASLINDWLGRQFTS